MLAEICAETRNYFLSDYPWANIHQGVYTVRDGMIASLDFLKEGQYFRIVGSTFNDGVYQYPAVGLIDESFAGAVWAMSVPPAFIALAADIKAWSESEAAKPSAYSSESFGGYSYTKATDKSGAPLTWQGVFAKRLKAYRRTHVI